MGKPLQLQHHTEMWQNTELKDFWPPHKQPLRKRGESLPFLHGSSVFYFS